MPFVDSTREERVEWLIVVTVLIEHLENALATLSNADVSGVRRDEQQKTGNQQNQD